MDRRQENAGRLVIAGGDCPGLLELGKEVLNEVAGLVPFDIIRTLLLAICLGRNDRDDILRLELIEDTRIGIIGTVSQQCRRLEARNEDIRAIKVGRLPIGQTKPGGIAQRITNGMNLRTEAPATATNRLGWPPFFDPPALC